ncbi:uncharacterized protein [Malus domestica]|uniref:uncharacterized protein n=1 Tax=Malus domestica TaxID=3750 RepID=UPI0039770A3B
MLKGFCVCMYVKKRIGETERRREGQAAQSEQERGRSWANQKEEEVEDQSEGEERRERRESGERGKMRKRVILDPCDPCLQTGGFLPFSFNFPTNWIKDLEKSPNIDLDGGVGLKVELKTPNSRVLHGFGKIGAIPGQIGLGFRRRSS